MTRPGNVLVVANSTDPESGYVGWRLGEHGLRLDTVFRDRDGIPAEIDAGLAMILLLGSEWSVAEPIDRAALEAECVLVRKAADLAVPVLGLCYGGQVIAAALGGRVSRASSPEVGLVEVTRVDPTVVPEGRWWEFHLDVIEPPPGASVVATNGCGVQAFTLEGMLGTQFHPEVLPETLDDWCARFPGTLAAAGTGRETLVATARETAEASRRAAYALVDGFLARAGLAARAPSPDGP